MSLSPVAAVYLILAASSLMYTTDASGTNGTRLTSIAKRKAYMKYGRKASACNLHVPESAEEQMYPHMDQENPLNLSVRMQVRDIRDVPDSGGSFGVDLK